MVEIGLANDTGKPRRLLIEGGGKILKSSIRVAKASINRLLDILSKAVLIIESSSRKL
jgi:hypothetical protein